MDEKILWTGSPSQYINISLFGSMGLAVAAIAYAGFYISPMILWLAVIPTSISIWKNLVTRMTRYELTSERFRKRTGVLNIQMDDLELYRIRDYRLVRPLSLRLFGLGSVVLETVDRTTPHTVIMAIPDAESAMNLIRKQVEACRTAKGVREIDV